MQRMTALEDAISGLRGQLDAANARVERVEADRADERLRADRADAALTAERARADALRERLEDQSGDLSLVKAALDRTQAEARAARERAELCSGRMTRGRRARCPRAAAGDGCAAGRWFRDRRGDSTGHQREAVGADTRHGERQCPDCRYWFAAPANRAALVIALATPKSVCVVGLAKSSANPDSARSQAPPSTMQVVTLGKGVRLWPGVMKVLDENTIESSPPIDGQSPNSV
jgi:hypothetical protein